MSPTLEPESLCERDDVDVQTETQTLTRTEFETARDLEDHLTLGVANDAGEVLLVADGVRGWTLPGAPVGPDDNWDTIARRSLESLTGVDAGIAEPVRVRRVEFERDDDADQQRTTYDVLVRTASVPGRPIADEPTVTGEDVTDVIWLDRVPEDASGAIAADIEAVLERSVE
ncbi:hypothetical protein Htur_0545 [Haloterrigena turkmenica DSM 5511]|uniref:Nudix hydrolase domain-containing protein n=1 Tax=Haloterrigena turkmenica (strain ATCC 51198 / DSM 5511 / JCM 9101 / NCIMB 13204 / VKM B-1734 / 4k) TaxID=543526 RepID=D2RVS9_HALTV|nr:hypothetical protein [Haloterrigena turkmenica]ADB59443.1 hypothetical protein Htur_0545 [Haloterrigena turkmenica DSM 5511]